MNESQRIIMNSISSMNEQRSRVSISCSIVLDLDSKLTFSVKWLVLDQQAMI